MIFTMHAGLTLTVLSIFVLTLQFPGDFAEKTAETFDGSADSNLGFDSVDSSNPSDQHDLYRTFLESQKADDSPGLRELEKLLDNFPLIDVPTSPDEADLPDDEAESDIYYPSDEDEPGFHFDDGTDPNADDMGPYSESKRKFSYAEIGKRPINMLRLGKREPEKRQISMLRLGKRPMNMLRLGKRPMNMLRLGKRPMNMLRLGKRPMNMLRLGKRRMNMLRLGKRPMNMLRLGKRPMNMLRLGKRRMNMLRLGKRPLSMLRLGKRPMNMLRLGKRPMNMLRLGKRPMNMLRLGRSDQ